MTHVPIRQEYAYDLLNREIRRIERDGGVQRTIYDRNGQVVRLIRPNEYNAQTDGGEGFQFTYDAQGRVLTVLSPEGQVLQTNTYDAEGRLLQRLDGMGGDWRGTIEHRKAERKKKEMFIFVRENVGSFIFFKEWDLFQESPTNQNQAGT